MRQAQKDRSMELRDGERETEKEGEKVQCLIFDWKIKMKVIQIIRFWLVFNESKKGLLNQIDDFILLI